MCWQRLVFSIIDLFLEGEEGIHHLNGNDSLYRAVILWKTAVVLCHLALNPTQGSNGGYLYADTREKLRVWNRNSRGMAYFLFFSVGGVRLRKILRKQFSSLMKSFWMAFHSLKVIGGSRVVFKMTRVCNRFILDQFSDCHHQFL